MGRIRRARNELSGTLWAWDAPELLTRERERVASSLCVLVTAALLVELEETWPVPGARLALAARVLLVAVGREAVDAEVEPPWAEIEERTLLNGGSRLPEAFVELAPTVGALAFVVRWVRVVEEPLVDKVEVCVLRVGLVGDLMVLSVREEAVATGLAGPWLIAGLAEAAVVVLLVVDFGVPAVAVGRVVEGLVGVVVLTPTIDGFLTAVLAAVADGFSLSAASLGLTVDFAVVVDAGVALVFALTSLFAEVFAGDTLELLSEGAFLVALLSLPLGVTGLDSSAVASVA